jgi:hypothetical protein
MQRPLVLSCEHITELTHEGVGLCILVCLSGIDILQLPRTINVYLSK